jgi:RAP1 GTPase activating protein 1
MYGNVEGSAAYEEFLHLMGKKIALAGHTGYRAGLRGGVGSDSTGEFSHYTKVSINAAGEFCEEQDGTARTVEIMWHVSTLLPYQRIYAHFFFILILLLQGDDPQQLQRKRHLGNDVVIVIFSEEDQLFDGSDFASQFNHVWIVVSKTTGGYTASVVSALGEDFSFLLFVCFVSFNIHSFLRGSAVSAVPARSSNFLSGGTASVASAQMHE